MCVCCWFGRNAFSQCDGINTREELEEERRLFYVVITRAKQRLWITYANTRYRFGQLVQNEPSRFIEEVPEEYMDRSFAGGGAKNQIGGSNWGKASAFDRMKAKNVDDGESGKVSQQSGTYYNSGPAVTKSTPSYLPPKGIPAKVKEHVPSADFVASDTSAFKRRTKSRTPEIWFW